MNREMRISLIGIVGLMLLVAPLLIRFRLYGERANVYKPPPTSEFTTAATPIPTITSLAQQIPESNSPNEMRPGPVVVDLAHFNRIDRAKFHPLAAALAQRGMGMRFWLPLDIDPMEIQSFLDFPDQSEKLAAQLEDASALVVVSPFFLWNAQEIEVVVQFVADGGRLFLISDPDNIGDVARDINNVGEPFGIVFNDDYLYNTELNDENFTYTFQGDFRDRARNIAGSDIVFYGARSITGSVTPQVISGKSTLSSARPGSSGFTTAAIAGLAANETQGRVLAMSDFDVLSEPFVDRFQNRQMLNFVADFLSGGGRTNSLTDFPGSLGKEVSLVYGTQSTIDAELLTLSAKLQQRLIRSGRELTLAQTAPLTDGLIITGTGTLSNLLPSINIYDSTRGGMAPDNGQSVADDIPMPTPPPATILPLADLPAGDLIYLASYATAGYQSSLLSDAGFALIQVARTPTPTPTTPPTPTATITPTPSPTLPVPPAPSIEESSAVTKTDVLTGTETVSNTVTITGTGALTSSLQVSVTMQSSENDAGTADDAVPGPVATAEGITVTVTISENTEITATVVAGPIITDYLITNSGLQLLAAESVIIMQTEREDGGMVVAVIASTAGAMRSGVERLLERNYGDCLVEEAQLICPYAQENGSPKTSAGTGNGGAATATPDPGSESETATPEGMPVTPTGEPESDPASVDPASAQVLIIDDNDGAVDGEESEADFYSTVLSNLSISPVTWNVAEKDAPTGGDLLAYDWIIWSSAGYADGGPTVADLDPIFEYLNDGGHITISSRSTFFGQTQDPPSRLVDFEKTSDVPQLTVDLPGEPIQLREGIPMVAPIQANTAENPSLSVVLRRGPDSDDTGEPLLFVLTDDEDPDASGARLMVLGMSVTWFPDQISSQLIDNMMTWMLQE